MANTNNTTANLKAKAAKMRSERILRALSCIHDGTMTLLSDDSIVNGGGKRYGVNAEGRCTCNDSTGFVTKFNRELDAAGIKPLLYCKHDYARQFAAGQTLKIARTAYRLKDSILLRMWHSGSNAVMPAAPLPTRGYITPEAFAAAVAQDFAP